MSEVAGALTYDVVLGAVRSAIVRTKDLGQPREISLDTALWATMGSGQDGEQQDCLDLDSLDVLDIVFSLEEDAGLVLPTDLEHEELITVGNLVDALYRGQQSSGEPLDVGKAVAS
jgi:hypothetical protein